MGDMIPGLVPPASAERQLEVDIGRDFSVIFNLAVNQAGATLVGATIRFTVKEDECDEVPLLQKTLGAGIEMVDDLAVEVRLSQADTRLFTPGYYPYELEIIEVSGFRSVAREGHIAASGVVNQSEN